ncbi:hypothetical protein [Afipia sp. Root123D2]|uniref:hypothetical protein n=1 Tax=Afipia sp. Root123D2 TaxID=1736436 RepID=UPI000A94598B|nr:hypothetical protein [Afipia sp. Root123D2]
MTVATEASYAELIYTGVETIFTPGMQAQQQADVHCGYLDGDGLSVELIRGTHFTVTLDSSAAVTIGRIAFPIASALSPLTIWVERITPAVQGTDFKNLNRFNPEVHQQIADAGAMRDAELRNRQNRTVTPFAVSETAVDFRSRRLKAADPIQPEDLVTKQYSDDHTGTAAQEAAEAARDIAVAAAETASADAQSAAGSANAAEGYAAILENPDYGFYVDAPTETRDYGTYAP